MKKRTKRAAIALLLTILMIAGTGCGSSSSQNVQDETATDAQTAAQANKTAETESGIETEQAAETSGSETTEAGNSAAGSMTIGTSSNTIEGAKYVMIYNPYIYDEVDSASSTTTSLGTGELASQINVNINRAGGLDEGAVDIAPKSQGEIAEMAGDVDISVSDMNRAGKLITPYEVGDTRSFYGFDEQVTTRVSYDFTCLATGEYCNIWSYSDSIDTETAERYAEEFDSHIYQTVEDTFGVGRFSDNGGKINFLCYPMYEGLQGVYYCYDIFAEDETTPEEIQTYGLNTDHAVVSLNSIYMTDGNSDTNMFATMAHEYQHQICMTDVISLKCLGNHGFMRTWLNESMSAYIEEVLYPGVKKLEGIIPYSLLSDNLKNGQSLYNFDTTLDDYIGAYGAVYLFAEYLTENGGDQVFSDIHALAAASTDVGLKESDALMQCVSEEFRNQVASDFTYPATIEAGFASETDLWMSKLTLDYYLSVLHEDSLTQYEDYPYVMLYDSTVSAEIEGGGRIIVETANGSYTIPDDADDHLIYIGLDENFNIVSEAICK